MNFKALFLAGLIAYGAYHSWHNRPVAHGAGEIAVEIPQQQEVDNDSPHHIKGYQVTPIAKFDITARLLSSENYRFGREAELSPIDFALGWGPMSDEAVLDKIDISQSGRFYFWHVDAFPISRQDIETHSANMHMIPVDGSVERLLKAVRVGQVVHIKGYLVEAKAADGWRWKSSLTRNDTGSGACELVLVNSLNVLN